MPYSFSLYLALPPRALTLAVSQPCLFYIFIGFYIYTLVATTSMIVAKVVMLATDKLLEVVQGVCKYASRCIDCVTQIGHKRLCCLGCKTNHRLLACIISVLQRSVLLLEHAIVLAECSMANCRNCVCVLDQSCGNAECANSSNNSNNSNKNISYGRNNGGHKDKIPDSTVGSFTDDSSDGQIASGSESKTSVDSDNVNSGSNPDNGPKIVVFKGHCSSYSSNNGSYDGGISGNCNRNGAGLKSAFKPYDPTEVECNMKAPLPPFVHGILRQDAQSSVVLATTEIFGQIWDHPSNYWNHWGWKTLSKWMEKVVHDLNEHRFRYSRLYKGIDQEDVDWAHSVLQMAYDRSLVELQNQINTFDYSWSPDKSKPKPGVFWPCAPPSF